MRQLGGINVAKPKEVWQQLKPEFPELMWQVVKWHMAIHRKKLKAHQAAAAAAAAAVAAGEEDASADEEQPEPLDPSDWPFQVVPAAERMLFTTQRHSRIHSQVSKDKSDAHV